MQSKIEPLFLRNDKKGQVSSGISWVVATLVIISILSISLYAASLLSNAKVVHYSGSERTEDLMMVKSLFSYFSLSDESVREEVFEQMSSKGDSDKYYADFDQIYKEINSALDEENA